MYGASEAAHSTTLSPHVKGVETETFLILSKISEQKEFLKNILIKYNAKNPEDIERMIEQGDIDEHPAYEDYLSALSYEQNIKDLKKLVVFKLRLEFALNTLKSVFVAGFFMRLYEF